MSKQSERCSPIFHSDWESGELVRFYSKCHINTTLAVMVNSLLRWWETFQECFNSSSQQLLLHQALKLSAGYTEDSSVIISQLWCLHSVLFQKGTVTHPELLDVLGFWGFRHILQSHWYLTWLYNPSHKAALFVWFCFNTPLSAQLASLGNDSHHHPPDPGFKITSYPQTNTQEGISKKEEEERKLWQKTAMYDKLNTAASSCVRTYGSTVFWANRSFPDCCEPREDIYPKITFFNIGSLF